MSSEDRSDEFSSVSSSSVFVLDLPGPVGEEGVEEDEEELVEEWLTAWWRDGGTM